MLALSVIECSKRWMFNLCMWSNFTQRVWVVCDVSHHDLFWIIPNPVRQQRVILSLESICPIPFQARATDVKMPKLRLHSSNHVMPEFVNVFGTIRGTWNQSNKDPYAICRCPENIFSNITTCEILRSGVPIIQNIGQVSLIRCTYDWHSGRSSRKFILCIPPPVAQVHCAVDSTTLRVSDVHQITIEVYLKWEMC
jgi:hypothetical protein